MTDKPELHTQQGSFKVATCGTCGGTGRIICLSSWIKTDRTRKERCGICGGTGQSSYRDEPSYVRFQANARASFPHHPDAGS